MSDKNQVLNAISSTVDEIQELLAKSGWSMQKDDKMEDEAAAAPEAPAAPAEEAAAPAMEGEASEEAATPPPPSPEGTELHAQGEPEDMAAEAKALSDEELDGLLEVLMAEKEARMGAAGGEAPAAPAAPAAEKPAMEAPAAEKSLQMSMKEDYAKMTKSIEIMANSMEKLSKEVADLKSKPAQTSSKVVSKPVVTNSQQVLNKSTEVEKTKARLNKSESLVFAEGELRKGNRLVDSRLIAEINLSQTQDELNAIQDRLSLEGLKFPEK
jgi:hypothetical protein